MIAAAIMLTASADAGESSTAIFRSQIERLLTLASEPSPKNLLALQRFYGSLPAERRNDVRLKYAYAVALIQQRQLHDASKLLHELAEEQPENPAVWRNQIWLELTMGERGRALTDIEQLASRAAAHQSSQQERLTDREMADFLGAVCGFLAGPWSQRVRPTDAQHIEDRLYAVFDIESQRAFDRSKAKVIERYDELRSRHQKRAGEELESTSRELNQARKSLGAAAQELGDKQQELKNKETKRSDDAKAKVVDIDNQRKTIDQKRLSLTQQIAPLEAQRLALLSQLLPEPLFLTRPTSIERANVLHNRPIRLALAPIVAKLTELEAELMLLNQREQELLGDRAATGMKYQQDLGKLAQQEDVLKRDTNRLKNDAKRLRSKSMASSPRLRAEAEQLNRFSTYAPFAFELEKQRLYAEAR